MAITKQVLKSKPECKVKFSLTTEEAGNAEQVALVGDFNSWDPAASPMKRLKNGDFTITLTLPVGSSNKFRYLADGNTWINDPQADAYEYCSFAQGDNSVLNL